jgi:hypothetical protein
VIPSSPSPCVRATQCHPKPATLGRFGAVALVAAGLLSVPVGARNPAHFPVTEIEPGMVAKGVTVFEGTKREPFTAHVLGVLENVVGPHRYLVLARLEGGPLARTGVIGGMSGSPVFIDGRLVGAVAYSLGQFSRDPIAGITPIAEMIDLTASPSPRRDGQDPPARLPVDEQSLLEQVRTGLRRGARFADQPEHLRSDAPGGIDLGLRLRPIATPVALGGLSEAATARLSAALSGLGLRALAGWSGAASAATYPDEPIQAGDAVGVDLVSGDLSMSATGTVTLVDQGRVYAFGHPLVNLGPVRMPMTRAYVHTVLPSLLDSFKIASAGPVVGTLQQDRATAIAGTLGPAPRTIPVRVTLDNDRGPQRRFAFDVTEDQTLTPTLAFFSVLSILQSYEREIGGATYRVRGRVRVKDRGTFSLDDVFAGDLAGGSAAGYVVTPLALLSRTDLAALTIEGVDLAITVSERPDTLAIERVWLDSARVRPGDTVTAHVALRPWRGPDVVRSIPLQIPANARGPLTLIVADATRVAPYDHRDLRQVSNVDDVAQLLALFDSLRRNSVLYVRLVSQDSGVVVSGQALSSLPPSVLAVMEADRAASGAAALRFATAGSWDVRVSGVVTGIRQVGVTLDVN